MEPINLRKYLNLKDNEFLNLEVSALDVFKTSNDAKVMTIHKFPQLNPKHLYFTEIYANTFIMVGDNELYNSYPSIEVKLIKIKG